MVCVAWMYVIFGLSRTQKSVSSALMGGFAPSSGEFDYHRFCSESLSNYDAGTSQVMTLGVPGRGKFAAHASLLLEENRSYHIREHASNCLRFPSSGPKEIQGPWDVLQRHVQIMIEDSIIYRNQPEKKWFETLLPTEEMHISPLRKAMVS